MKILTLADLLLTAFIALLVACCVGCPQDTSDHLELIDDTLTGRYHTTDEDTLPDVSNSLCSWLYTIIHKYPNAQSVAINYYHNGTKIGFIIINNDETIAARNNASHSNYKDTHLLDFKVATYEGHTPLALKLTTDQLRPILQHARSTKRTKGIMGTPLIERNTQPGI